MQPTDAQIDAAAMVLRRARECTAPLQEDGTLPCPFCNWEWHQDSQAETGCRFVAEEMLKAASAGDKSAKLKSSVSDLIKTMESKRDCAKAASKEFPGRQNWLLGAAEAYNDAAQELRAVLKRITR